MSIRNCYWGIVLAAMLSPLSMAGDGAPIGAAADYDSELALRLFAERERARGSQLPYALAYPIPGQFSAQTLEQQNRALFYWLWQPGGHAGWPAPPYWAPPFPMGWPIVSPWVPPPVPSP